MALIADDLGVHVVATAGVVKYRDPFAGTPYHKHVPRPA